MKILIHGSCVSNDIFSFVKHHHKLAAYVPRLSMAAAFGMHAPSPVIESAKKNIASLTHRFWVLNDLEKRMERILSATNYDIILIDFIDERFNMAETDNGSIITITNEFRMAKFDESGFKTIKSTSDRHYELWKSGLESFSRLVNREKVFINRVYWSADANDGSNFDKNNVAAFNLFLDKLYHHAADTHGFNFIDYDKSVFISDAAHKWGKSPWHFTRQYYVAAMNALNSIEKDQLTSAYLNVSAIGA
jgi:hypothetical protein